MSPVMALLACADDPTTPAALPELRYPPTTTGTTPPTAPLEPIPGLAPARVLVGASAVEGAPREHFAAAVTVLEDSDGDGLPELLVTEDDASLVIPTPLAPGDVSALVTASLPSHSASSTASADMDRDGFGDVWIREQLFLGPFAGTVDLDAAAAVLAPISGDPLATGFDGDGDGWPDLAVGQSYDYSATLIFYGPFAGTVGEGDRTVIEGYYCDVYEPWLTPGPWLLGEVNRPGEVVLVAGHEDCGMQAYDIAGPRGRGLPMSAASAELYGRFEPLPDADGDGLTDLLLDWAPRTAAEPGASLWFLDQADAHALPDVTGDSLGDLLVEIRSEVDNAWYVVPGTTRGEGLDAAGVGVRLAPIPQVNPADPRSLPYMPRWTAADLDGDGLAEVIASQPSTERPGPSGWVWIYLGADIARAYAEVGLTPSFDVRDL